MAEVLGKLDPGADTSMLTDYESLTRLEQAEITLAVSSHADRMVEEASSSETGQAIGRFIVGFPDGRVVTAGYNVFIGKEKEKQ